jgi:hypothetical protein
VNICWRRRAESCEEVDAAEDVDPGVDGTRPLLLLWLLLPECLARLLLEDGILPVGPDLEVGVWEVMAVCRCAADLQEL